MSNMTTTLKEFSNNGDSITYVQSATHTAAKPRLVLQKRRVPVGNQTVLEDTVTVLSATVDSNGETLPQRVSFSATIRRPIDGQSSDVADMLAVFRDIIAGDEFGNTVDTQEWLL
jgi:hypothetical protein